jgi:hypothetical protein
MHVIMGIHGKHYQLLVNKVKFIKRLLHLREAGISPKNSRSLQYYGRISKIHHTVPYQCLKIIDQSPPIPDLKHNNEVKPCS